jgi:hypothetical protein
MFPGPINLYDNGIKFKLQNLNPWELESIYDIIKNMNRQKPTKKQFVCSLKQNLNFEFFDYSNINF